MEEKQRQYDSFAQTSSIQHQEMLCGPKPSVSRGNELYYIENYSKNTILDIGCGTGHRTFPEYINKNIKYFGIEKSREYAVQSSVRIKDFLKNNPSICHKL